MTNCAACATLRKAWSAATADVLSARAHVHGPTHEFEVIPASPFVRNAQAGRLPYKVHASLHTDTRTTPTLTRESIGDILRRTMPRNDGEVK